MEAHILPSASLAKHYPIAFNLIPQIDVFLDNLYTKEEMKMVNETKKIMHDDEMRITATTVRVPVYRSHSESVNIEFEHDLELADMVKALSAFPGVVMQDDPESQVYPMPLYTSDKDDCYVGRLRRDFSNPNTFNLWVAGDQIRKGAALNTLQIAEVMIKNGWI
jgi:aspartate-semialdehyde dehydrogenase